MNICKGHVYIIFCHINPKIYYVGSTFNQLKQRWNNHKTATHKCCINKYFHEYGIENFSIKLIKTYNVYREHSKDRKHLEAYELLWINKLKGCCNELLPFNPLKKIENKEYKKQHYKKNKEHYKEYKKEWNEKNKEKRKQQQKERYENNKEQLNKKKKEYYKNNKKNILEKNKEYYENNKKKYLEKCKEYRDNNQQKIKQKNKQYREDNKQHIKEKAKEKYTCECGTTIGIYKKNRHFKSKKHQDYIKNNINNI